MFAIVITSVIYLVIILYHGFLDKSIWISAVFDKNNLYKTWCKRTVPAALFILSEIFFFKTLLYISCRRFGTLKSHNAMIKIRPCRVTIEIIKKQYFTRIFILQLSSRENCIKIKRDLTVQFRSSPFISIPYKNSPKSCLFTRSSNVDPSSPNDSRIAVINLSHKIKDLSVWDRSL